jgi:hypothetical protein
MGDIAETGIPGNSIEVSPDREVISRSLEIHARLIGQAGLEGSNKMSASEKPKYLIPHIELPPHRPESSSIGMPENRFVDIKRESGSQGVRKMIEIKFTPPVDQEPWPPAA